MAGSNGVCRLLGLGDDALVDDDSRPAACDLRGHSPVRERRNRIDVRVEQTGGLFSIRCHNQLAG
jgi:hypothetical protein